MESRGHSLLHGIRRAERIGDEQTGALAVFPTLAATEDRANIHGNLASHFEKGDAAASRNHQVADLAYVLLAGFDPQQRLHNLAVRIYEADVAGTNFCLPPVVAILADPAFASLRRFLDERAVSPLELQSMIDAVVKQARVARASFVDE